MGKIDAILSSMQEEMPFGFVIPDRVRPYLHEAFKIYAKAVAEDALKMAVRQAAKITFITGECRSDILSTKINLDL